MGEPAAKKARVGEGGTENEVATLRAVCNDIRGEFFDAVGLQMGSAHFFATLPCGHGFDDHHIHRICDAANGNTDVSDDDSDDGQPPSAAACPLCKAKFSRLCFRHSIGPFNPASKINANIIRRLRQAARERNEDIDAWQKHDADTLAIANLQKWHADARSDNDAAAAAAYCTIGENAECIRIAQNWQPGVWLIDRESTKFRSGKTLLCRAFALYIHGYHLQSVRARHREMTYCLGGCNINAILAERLSAPHGLSNVEAWVLAKIHLEDTLELAMPRKSIENIAARFYAKALQTRENRETPFFDEAAVRKMAAEGEIKKSTANRMLEFTEEYITVFANTKKAWKLEKYIV